MFHGLALYSLLFASCPSSCHSLPTLWLSSRTTGLLNASYITNAPSSHHPVHVITILGHPSFLVFPHWLPNSVNPFRSCKTSMPTDVSEPHIGTAVFVLCALNFVSITCPLSYVRLCAWSNTGDWELLEDQTVA